MSRSNDGPFAFQLPSADDLKPRKYARQTRAKATVEAIQEAAFQVLEDEGYDRLTTTRVAERAGVSVGTLYQYYGNKLSLVRALLVAYLDSVDAALREVLEQPSELRVLAREFVRRFVAFKRERRACSTALRTVLVLADARPAIDERVEAINRVLAQRIGAARPTWSADGRAQRVASMWTATVLGTVHEMLERDPDRIAEPWFSTALEAGVLSLLDLADVET